MPRLTQVFCEIGPHTVDIHKPHIHDSPTSNSIPGSRSPLLMNEPVDQDMQVRIAVALQLHDPDKADAAVLTVEVDTELPPHVREMGIDVALDLLGI